MTWALIRLRKSQIKIEGRQLTLSNKERKKNEDIFFCSKQDALTKKYFFKKFYI